MAKSHVIREGMMIKKYYTAAVLIILITAGCSHYGALQKDYGKSYDMATSGQILNPLASKNPGPVMGLSGKASDATMKKYTDSFSSSGQSAQGPQSFAITPMVPTDSTGTGQNVYGK
jgi:hypothetical protein